MKNKTSCIHIVEILKKLKTIFRSVLLVGSVLRLFHWLWTVFL
jgi:hypothetical protein